MPATGLTHRLGTVTAGLAFLATLGVTSTANAQVPYFKNQFAQPYVALTGGTAPTFTSTDDGEALVPIGFPFTYYGQTYSQITVGTNGAIAMANACTGAAECPGGSCTGGFCRADISTSAPNPSFPNSGGPQQMIGGVWDDLIISTRGSITTQVVGVAPNREMVVQYTGVPHYSNSVSDTTFQIRLAESTGAVRLHYGTFNAVASENTTWTFANGLENQDGTQGDVGIPCATSNGCNGTELTGLDNTVIEWIQAAGVELVGGGTAPTGGLPGSTIDFDITVRNLGTTTAPSGFTADVYLSTGATVTSTDTLLGTATFATGLTGPGGSDTQRVTATVPSMLAPGVYTVGVIVDPNNQVAEYIEGNNTAVLNNRFLVGVDLSVEVDTPPDTGPGEVATLTYRVLNYGAPQPAVPVRLYLSQDDVLDPADFEVATTTVSVGAQLSTEFTVTATLPNIQPTNYYVIAEVDPDAGIVEADETNNIGVSPTQVFLDGAELVAEAVASSSQFAFLGDPLTVTGIIDNTGGATARGFVYGLYVSDNLLCSAASDTELGEIGPIDLAAESSLPFSHDVTVPTTLTPGTYYLCLIVNATNAVLEQNQNNNIKRMVETLTVRARAADFALDDVRSPALAAAGEAMFVERTLLNLGNAADDAEYTVYLSTDDVLDAGDVAVLNQTVTVQPAVDQSDVDLVPVPGTLSPGVYYVIYQVDPNNVVDELFEDNNERTADSSVVVLGTSLFIATQSLPIGTVGVMYDVTLTATGAASAVTWSVEGTLPVGITLDAASGRLSGVPTEEGLSELTITAASGGITTSHDYNLLVAEQTEPLEVITRALPASFVATGYSVPLTAFGGVPPYTWSLGAGDALPTGTVDFELSETGQLTGVPDTISVSRIIVRVTDSLGAFAEQNLVLRVVQASDSVRLADDALPDARLDEQYDVNIATVSGTGEGPYVFALAGGALPDGLTMSEADISGIPSRVGVFMFAVRVVDSRGDFDLNQYIIEVTEAGGITFVTNAVPRGTRDVAYADEDGSEVQIRTLTDSGTVSISLVSGSLPTGMSINTDGVISGTPTLVGTFNIVVLATDSAGQTDVRAYGIIIDEPPAPPVTTPMPEDGCTCAQPGQGSNGLWSLGLLSVFGLLLTRRRRSILGLFAALVVLSPTVASAQVPYMVDTRTETYTPRTTGGTALSFSSTDDGEAIVPLPFAFKYFDNYYNEVHAGTNGILRFGDIASSRFNTVMPSTLDVENIIAFFWDDCEDPVASIFVEGTAPNRVAIIQYDAMIPFFSTTGGSVAVQIFLHEGEAARFEVKYGPITGMTDPSEWTASAGYEDSTGTIGGPLLPCNGACDGTDFVNAENLVVRVQQDGGTDVQATGVTVPEVAYAGVDFQTQVTLQSLHTNPIGPLSYEVHLMAPGETVPNNLLFTSAPLTLSGFETKVIPTTVTMPLSAPNGRYRLAVVADSGDDLVEPNESNNVFISTADFFLAPQQPDFIALSVAASQNNVAPGATVSLTANLRNRGNLEAAADWQLVLSQNQVISPDDVLLDSGNVNLPLLTTATIATDITLPAGTPAGVYYLGLVVDGSDQVSEIDELNNTVISGQPLVVAENAVNVATQALPGAYVGIGYTHFLRASGGDGDYVWSVSGSLPAGLQLIPGTGEITGTPTGTEDATFDVTVTSGGQTDSVQLTLSVVVPDGGLSIVTRQLLPGVVGAAYPPAEEGVAPEMQQRFRAVGAQGEVTFSLDGAVPPGLTLDADGYLHGVPVQATVHNLVVVAKDDVSEVRRDVLLTIADPGRLTLVADTLPAGTVGTGYQFSLRFIGGAETSTPTFSAISGLPPGIVVGRDGTVTGTPERVGVWTFTVTVEEDSSPSAARDTAQFRLEVQQDRGFEISSTALPVAFINEAFEEEIAARGGEGDLTWRFLGPPLQAGLETEVANVDGAFVLRFRGTPTEVGVVTLLVTAEDEAGRIAEAAVTVEVAERPEEPAPLPEPSGCTSTRGSLSVWVLLGAGLLLLRRRRR